MTETTKNPTNLSITELVNKAVNDYNFGTTHLSKYVDFSLSDNVNKIEAYANSKFTTGDTDSLGREKPFFNIVQSAVNIWYRATDLDRRHIRLKATKNSDFTGVFLATAHLQDWMKKAKFGQFLNEWGRTLAKYGSAITKFVEKEGELSINVISWNRMIIDSVDFESNPRIEILELTPSQLKQNEAYDQNVVREILSTKESRKTIDGQQKDNKSDYIKIYEVHGNLPLSYITNDADDDDTYTQQIHIVYLGNSKDDRKVLFQGKETRDPYRLDHLIKEDGRSQSIGAIEYLFEAQWMMNHTAKQIKDQLDLASKLIFQTSDGNFVGMNVLSSMEQGDILIHTINQPLTQLANNSHDITALQNYGMQWKQLAQEIVSTPDVLMGNNFASGTAWRQSALVQQESYSNFAMMVENKGLAIEEMMREYIIPYLKKKMDTSKEITATLDDYGIKTIDNLYVKSLASRKHNTKIIEELLQRSPMEEAPVEGIDIQAEQQKIKEDMSVFGNQRFFKPSETSDKTWKEVFKDLEWECEVEITNENTDKQATLDTLSTVLQTVASNPAILQDPNARMVFNKILQETGKISPMELSIQPTQPQIQPQPQQIKNNNQPVAKPETAGITQ